MKMKLCIYILSSSEQYIYVGDTKKLKGGEGGLYISGKTCLLIWILDTSWGNKRSWLDKNLENNCLTTFPVLYGLQLISMKKK